MCGRPLFHVLPHGNANRLFEAFGNAFEQYAGETLERTFPAAPGLVSPLVRNIRVRTAAGEQFEIDAVLNYVISMQGLLERIASERLRESRPSAPKQPAMFASVMVCAFSGVNVPPSRSTSYCETGYCWWIAFCSHARTPDVLLLPPSASNPMESFKRAAFGYERRV